MNIPAIIRRAVVTAMVVAAALGGSTQTASATTPVETQAAHRFCETVNNERAARGLDAVACTYNGAAQAAVETHQDLTAVWMPGTENGAEATRMFMQSTPHRVWLLMEHPDSMDIGVQCVNTSWGGPKLYVGADFSGGHLRGPDDPIPPQNPIVTPHTTTNVCTPATPPSTAPPATAPPATRPPATATPVSPPAPSDSPSSPSRPHSAEPSGGTSGTATSGPGSSSAPPSTSAGGKKPGATSTSKGHPTTTTRSSTSLTRRSRHSLTFGDGSDSKQMASGSNPRLSPEPGTTRGSGGSDLGWWLTGGAAILAAESAFGFVAWRRARA